MQRLFLFSLDSKTTPFILSAFGGLAALSNTIGQLALDSTTGDLYVADTGNSAIRKIEYSTGIITTVAGGNLGGYAGTFFMQF